MKTLVAYFSASGVTKKVGEEIAKIANGDTFEIVPETLYTKADLNWEDKQSRSSVEMQDKSSRPAIATKTDISSYDTIYIGFPIWWYTAPTIIATFLESYDFSGKTLIPFATAGSSEFGNILDDLKGYCPNANWKNGKKLKADVDVAEINQFIIHNA
jgi:flavodoxin